MKRIIAIALIFCTVIFTGCQKKASEFDNGKMRKNMTAMEYSQEMRVGLNLGNTFDGFWENLSNKTSGASVIGSNTPQDYEKCWGATVTTPECINGIKEAGFNTIRIPVYWGNMMEDNGEYKINGSFIARVKEVVDYARKSGLYVVINMHHYDAFLVTQKDKDEVLKATRTVWMQVAEYFKDYSDYLIFEGFNEALGSLPEGVALSEEEIYDYVNEMNRTFVDAVRSTGGNNEKRILIVSGYWTNIDYTTKDSFILPEDSAKDRMMVSVHYIDNACYWTNTVGGQSWLDYSKSQCELLKNAFTSRNIPVFVGECTGIYDAERIEAGASVTDSSECLSTILNMAADYGFVPVIWDVNDGFYSRTECKIKSERNQTVIKEISEKIENK